MNNEQDYKSVVQNEHNAYAAIKAAMGGKRVIWFTSSATYEIKLEKKDRPAKSAPEIFTVLDGNDPPSQEVIDMILGRIKTDE